MPRGRPRKTDEQKKREGTFRKDRSTPEAPQFKAVSCIPPAPEGFDKIAVDVWNTICQELIDLNILQSIDIFSIQIICQEMSLYWKCINKMGDQIVIPTGTGSEKINPLYQAATTALNNANKIAAQYGFTPTARMRLKIVADAKPKTNPAIDIINKKRLLK